MKFYANIEKSAFRKGEYVGYGDQVYRIRKSGTLKGFWECRGECSKSYFVAEGLDKVSKQLMERAEATNRAIPNPSPFYNDTIPQNATLKRAF